MIRILASASPGEVRVAVLDGDTLADYALWRPGSPDGLGDVHAGRVTARVPAMAGAFVDLGGADGFLPDSAGAAGLAEGTILAVHVTRSAQGGKGPRLAALPDMAVSAPARLLRRGPGALRRLADLHPGAPVAVDDAALFAALRPALGERLHCVARAFDDALEAEVDALCTPMAALPGGLRASIVPTPALVAIDVDGAVATAARAAKSAAQLAANRVAIPALARQIALRNLSGAILIDFAGIPIKRRAALAPDLTAALAADPARPRLLGFSHLGLAEILRPRSAAPLHELLAGPHAAGLAALRALAADPARRGPVLRASPSVVAALRADTAALPDLARRLTHPLMLRSDPALPQTGWAIEEAA